MSNMNIVHGDHRQASLNSPDLMILPYLPPDSDTVLVKVSTGELLARFNTLDDTAFTLMVCAFSHEYIHKLIWEWYDHDTTFQLDRFMKYDHLERGI